MIGPNECRVISREDVGFYNALAVAANYELGDQDIDYRSPETYIAPLRHCVTEHPFLSVVVKNKHTDRPTYDQVGAIDFNDHISITCDDEPSSHDENAFIQDALLPILDRPWPADVPPWRIVVLPSAPAEKEHSMKRCCVVFAFSHTIGDGMVGLTFHQTFSAAWRKQSELDPSKQSWSMTIPSRTVSEPFDTRSRLPISWSYLLLPGLGAYLPTFVADFFGLRAAASTIDAGTWTGSMMSLGPAGKPSTRLKLLEIEQPLLQKALKVSRTHGTKLTATLHQLIVRAMSKTVTSHDVTNYVSCTAVDMRRSISLPSSTWGLFVTGFYDVHPRLSNEDTQERPVISDEMWATARLMTSNLADCATRLQDQAIGLLRFLLSIRRFTQSKLGHRRDASYEVSNLLSYDNDLDGHENGAKSPERCRISKMFFAQPANVLSAPLFFNVVSVKGGSLICIISWQCGALGVPIDEEQDLVDRISSSLRADFEHLGDY